MSNKKIALRDSTGKLNLVLNLPGQLGEQPSRFKTSWYLERKFSHEIFFSKGHNEMQKSNDDAQIPLQVP